MNSNAYRNMMSNHDNMVQQVPAGPFEKMAWSGSNSLGNVVEFQPSADNRQMVLKLDEWGPPEMWTISLGLSNVPPSMNINEVFRITSEIEFGVGGATQIVETDWGNGMMFSVPMNAVNIAARYEFISEVLPSDYTSIRLSAMISRGVTSSKYPACKTINIPEIPVDGFFSGKLPPFTRELEFRFDANNYNPYPALVGEATLVMGPGMNVAGHVSSSAATINLNNSYLNDGWRYPTANNSIYYEFYTGSAGIIRAHMMRCLLAV